MSTTLPEHYREILLGLGEDPDREHLDKALDDNKIAREDLDALAESGPDRRWPT